jgi:hypothetical protein
MAYKIPIMLILALIFNGFSELHGQDTLANNDKDTTMLHWEIGLDLLWLIDKHEIPPTSLFLRYNFYDKKGNAKALRFRIGLHLQSYDSINLGDARPSIANVTHPYLRLGYEWQQKINNEFWFFYGFDLSAQYYHIKSKRLIYFTDIGPRLLQVTDKTWQFGIFPLVGFKYHPTKWFSISLESTVNFSYRMRSYFHKTTTLEFPDRLGGHWGIDANDFKTTIQPISVINFSYFFN